MGVMVSLNLVIVGIFATLAVLSLAVFVGQRRLPALAWLAFALICGTLETLLYGMSRGSAFELVPAYLLVPGAYVCFGEAVRLVTAGRRRLRVVGVVAGLSALSVVLLAFDVPFVVQSIPFQLACAVAIGDAILRLVRNRPGLVDYMLIGVLSGVAAIFLVRIPLYPLLLGADAAYNVVRASPFEKATMTASALLTPPAVFLLLGKIIGKLIATYRTRAEHDGLTGLYNRRTLDEAALVVGPNGGAVIFCDIDHFKQVNDRYGHQVGDDVICAFAALIRRTGYRAGRIGGEEFALLLPGKSVAEAGEVADMIRRRFHEASLTGIAPGQRLSASFGVAGYVPRETATSAFVAADAALYAAKSAGRNRTMLAPAAAESLATAGEARAA